ncbi:MAG: 50S ribosomal protein L17 [Candidatus Omnitrophota bacterium]
MRHKKKKGLLLNRFTSWQKATTISLARNLLIHQSIKTTLSKARAARPLAEKLISLAKENTLSAKRRAFSILSDHTLVSRLFTETGPLFEKRNSGYTRIITLGPRRGDNATLALLELTEIKKKERPLPKKEKEEKLPSPEKTEEKAPEKKKPETAVGVQEKPSAAKKPTKKFLGGIRNIFKKERDSL